MPIKCTVTRRAIGAPPVIDGERGKGLVAARKSIADNLGV